MIPEQPAVGHFVQFGNPYAVFVRGDMLCTDIHGDFAQVEVCADACRRRDAGAGQHFQNQLSGKLPGGQLIGA